MKQKTIYRLEFILLSENVDKVAKGGYLVCPVYSSKRLDIESTSDSIEGCMKEISYIRIGGVIKQVK